MTVYDLSDMQEMAKMITDIEIKFVATEAIGFIEHLINRAIEEDISEYRKSSNEAGENCILPADANCITYEVVYQPFICESLIVSIYRLLETAITQFCDFSKIRESLEAGYESCKGKGMEKKFNFIEQVLGYNLERDSKLWEQLMAWRRVRNALVHNDGSLEGKGLEQCRRASIKLDEDNKVVIDFSDCKQYLQVVSTFLNKIYTQSPRS